MLKIGSLLLILVLWASQVLAQSALVFKDQSGFTAGTLVQFRELSDCDNHNEHNALWSCNAILRQNAHLLQVNLDTGELKPEGFWFHSSDCTGVPHMQIGFNGARGGVIVYSRHGSEPILGVVEWYPVINPSTLNSRLDGAGGCVVTSSTTDAVPIKVVDPPVYGVKELPEVTPGVKGLGFLPPLVPQVLQSEIIFCNGLENCPQ